MWRRIGDGNIILSKRRGAMWDRNMWLLNSGKRRHGRGARATLLMLVLVALVAGAGPTTNSVYQSCPPSEDGIGKVYMGREIAQVMGHLAADWLERPEREQEEEPTKLLEALKVKPGDVIGDIGAGSGYLSFPLAKRVGPQGKVLAVDIQPQMLKLIRERMKADKVENVEPVLGTITDPKLPDNSVDLIVMVDVYHEFSHPFEMAQAMVRALKPGGRLVFV